jgi:hypothetical protein
LAENLDLELPCSGGQLWFWAATLVPRRPSVVHGRRGDCRARAGGGERVAPKAVSMRRLSVMHFIRDRFAKCRDGFTRG